jgi:hypothetical protein
MKHEGYKTLRKMGWQTPYFNSGGGQERGLAIQGLRALEPPASKTGSVTMTSPLSRALRHGRGIKIDRASVDVTMTSPLSRALRQSDSLTACRNSYTPE